MSHGEDETAEQKIERLARKLMKKPQTIRINGLRAKISNNLDPYANHLKQQMDDKK